MLRYFIFLFVSLSLSACVDRTVSEVVPAAANIGTPEIIFASTTRAREVDGSYGFRRGETLRFLETTVSIPPTHTPGTLKFSYANPNPQKEFVLADVTELDGPRHFIHVVYMIPVIAGQIMMQGFLSKALMIPMPSRGIAFIKWAAVVLLPTMHAVLPDGMAAPVSLFSQDTAASAAANQASGIMVRSISTLPHSRDSELKQMPTK